MSEPQEVLLDAQPKGSAFRFDKIRAIFNRFTSLPVLHPIGYLTRKALLAAEPIGRVYFRKRPNSISSHRDGLLTVLSANLWHDWPRHRRMQARLEAFAQLVETEKVDLLLLQEVSRTPDLHVDKWLADRLQMAYIYSRANGHHMGIGFEEGVAVFSRFALDTPLVRQLRPNFEPFVRRLALGARVETPSGPLLAFSVHLGFLPSMNAAQGRHLQTWVSAISDGSPALIGGDFNAREHAEQIGHMQKAWIDVFRRLNPKGDGATHELRLPWRRRGHRQRLDYVFLSPGNRRWEVLEARHLDAPGGPHSDHRAVLARIVARQ